MALRELRVVLGRPTLALVAALGLLVGGCDKVGSGSITFWDVVWSMIIFFFWFMAIWIFIAILSDVLRRNDLSGGAKAIWVLVIFILPLLGALIYLVMRPKVTAQDVQMMTQADAAAKAASGVTTADQIEKLNQLLQTGAITQPEYEALKKKAMEG